MTTGYNVREGSLILADRRRALIAELARQALAIIDGRHTA